MFIKIIKIISYFQEALQSLQFYRGTSIVTPQILEEMAQLKQQTESGNKALAAEMSAHIGAENEMLNQVDTPTGSASDITPWKMLCKFIR